MMEENTPALWSGRVWKCDEETLYQLAIEAHVNRELGMSEIV